jgi:hypothetical protein
MVKILFFLLIFSGTLFSQRFMDMSIPPPPPDTSTRIFNGSFKTKKFYGAEENLEEMDSTMFWYSEVYYYTSDSFVRELNFDFKVDTPFRPTKLFMSNFEFKIQKYIKYEQEFFYLGADSMRHYQSEWDFDVTLHYNEGFLESVAINFEKITDKSFLMAQKWYDSLKDQEKLEIDTTTKEKLLISMINKLFLKNLAESFPLQNYLEYLLDLIKRGHFGFVYTNESIDYFYGNEKWWFEK